LRQGKQFITITFSLLALLAATAPAERVHEPRLAPADPIAEGMGSATVALPGDGRSFFSNPAGFASPGGELTVATGAGAVRASRSSLARMPTDLLLGNMSLTPDGLPRYFDSAVYEGRFRQRGSAGIGFAGSGLGLALFGAGEMTLEGGDEPTGSLLSELTLVGGLGAPLEALGGRFQFGVSARPFVRIYAPELFGAEMERYEALREGESVVGAFGDVPTRNGFGIALDAGALFERGPFSVGIAAFDIGDTSLSYEGHPLSSVADSFADGRLPEGGTDGNEQFDPDARYLVPMQTRLGAAFSSGVGASLFGTDLLSVTLGAELRDLHSLFFKSYSPTENLHTGLELELARFVSGRAGYAGGDYTLGAGIRLGIFRLDSTLRFAENESAEATLGASIRF